MNAGQPNASGNEINASIREEGNAIDAPRGISPRQDMVNNDSGGGAGGGAAARTGTTTATMVLTQHENSNNELPVLRLQLRPRSNVTWDEQVVNNEGLGRKSSKRCCIFHKSRAFGESSTESSDDDGSTSSSSSGGEGSGNAQRPMARKKNNKKMGGIGNKPKVPDYQRFHA